MSPRGIVTLVGLGILLQGIVFEVIQPSTLAHAMVMVGIGLALAGRWPVFVAHFQAHRYRTVERRTELPPDFSKPSPEVGTSKAQITGPGNYRINAVGESRYQRELDRIVGGKTEDGHEFKCKAVLVLEDANQYDPKAVRVEIAGQVVGYLDRKTARSYRKQLKKGGLAGLNLSCNAMIVGGWDRGGDDVGHYGVKVDLPMG